MKIDRQGKAQGIRYKQIKRGKRYCKLAEEMISEVFRRNNCEGGKISVEVYGSELQFGGRWFCEDGGIEKKRMAWLYQIDLDCLELELAIEAGSVENALRAIAAQFEYAAMLRLGKEEQIEYF